MTQEQFQKACRLGDVETLESILLDHPYMINQPDRSQGWAPLYRTVICGHLEATSFLLSSGANPNIRTSLGETPLHSAADNNLLKIAQLLIDSGADPNPQQNNGDTPLHLALYKNHMEMVHLLLSNKADASLICKVAFKRPLQITPGCDVSHMPSEQNEEENFIITEELSRDCPPVLTISDKPDFKSPVEPEAERAILTNNSSISNFSFGGDTSPLQKWLWSNRLGFLHFSLSEAGFDDLDVMVQQMGTSSPITEDMLETIGIDKPGHRHRLLFLLHRETLPSQTYEMFELNPTLQFRPDLFQWLDLIQLGYLKQRFYDTGYDDLDHLVMLMISKLPLTDEILRDKIGVEKLGHRQKILTKLMEEVSLRGIKTKLNTEHEETQSACEFCSIM